MKQIIKNISFAVLCLAAILAAPTAFAQKPKTITGQVYDNSGQPMIGATVVVVGTTNGTTTDTAGKFTIKAKADDSISFSFLGYTEVTERVGTRTQINIILKPDNVNINEVVVIGYGTQQKSDITGSVTSLNMSELSDMPTISVDEALQGRIAGVEIVSMDGEPGAGSSIRVRGSRSIEASNEPLIVVDGVMDAVENFADIDPSDIKNVTVLKDASSTAIYGSRGANGVILVTTNMGQSNKFDVTFSANIGISEIPRSLDIMNASEFAQYRNDRYLFSKGMGETLENNLKRPSEWYPYSNPQALGEGTNWQDALTRTGLTQNYFLSLSGGGKSSKAYFSFAYTDVDGVVINTGMERMTGRLKFDQDLFKWLKVGINTSYSWRHNDQSNVAISGTSTTSAIATSPINSLYGAWNTLGDTGTDGGTVYDNPYLKAVNITNERENRTLNVAPYIEIRPVKGLSVKSTFSYSVNDTETFYYSPSTMPVAAKRHLGGTAYRSSTYIRNLLSETIASYNHTFKKKHKLGIMAGFTAQNNVNDYVYTKGVGYLDDNVTYNNLGSLVDKRNITETTTYKEIQRMSVLGRATYSYDGRYHATVTMRYDGSSNFSAGNKWAFFPAAAFKWSLNNEKWLKSAKWLSELALRVSAGRTGNDSVSSYVSQMALSNTNSWLFGEIQEVSYYPTRLDNPNLTWEKTDSYNIGIDFAVLKNRLSFSIEGYKSFTSDLLMTVQNGNVSGYTTRFANIGSTENTGIEFSVTSRNISRPKFQWTTNLTISHNTQIVTDLGSDVPYVATYSFQNRMLYGYVKDYPANSLWGFQFAGVWHSQEDIDRNSQTRAYMSYADESTWMGKPRYVDVNNDGVLDDHDRIYLGSSDPIIHGGFNNTFRIIKNLTIGVYFTYSLGGKIYNLSELYMGSGSTRTNQYRYMCDAWHPVRNPYSDIPRAGSLDYYPNQRYVHDASYLRLQNVSVSYTFDLKKHTRYLRDITLAANVKNAYLWSKYNGYDPDVASSTIRRFDNGAYPRNRQYTISVKIRY